MSELVGDAYVRLTVDSSGIRGAVKREGEKAGDEFKNGFDKRMKKAGDDSIERLMDSLARAFVDLDFGKFEKKMGGVDEAVEGVTAALEKLNAEGKLSNRMMRDMGADLRKWEKARKDILSTEEELAEQNRLAVIYEKTANARLVADRELRNSYEKTNAEQVRGFEERNKFLDQQGRIQVAAYALMDREAAQSAATRQRILEIGGKAQIRFHTELRKAIREGDRETLAALGHQENAILRIGHSLDDFGDRWQIFGDRVGRIFGAGSRNNFLNLFGRSIGALATPLRGVIELFGKVGQGIGGMIQTFQLASEQGLTFTQSLGKVGAEVLPMLVTGAVALGAAIAAVAIVLPAMVSGFVLLGGAITAVVGAIAFALGGALLALGPVLLAVLAAAGAIAIAFKGMSEEGSKAAASIKRVSSAWSKVMKGMKDEVEGVADALGDTLTPLIENFVGPLMTKMLGATELLVRDFGKVFNNPAMSKFLDTFENSLPKIFTNFGGGINSLLGGLTAFFSAILPYAERLSGAFDNLMDRFLAWSMSAKGQNTIGDWMDTAFKAATSLWNILGNVTSILGKVFKSSTEGAGQDFLTYIETITDRFDKFLSSPEGQTAMKNFWVDVRETMVTVKDIFESLGRTIDNLDTQAARDDFNTFMKAIESVTKAIEVVSLALGILAAGPLSAAGAITGFIKNFDAIEQTLVDWGDNLGDWVRDAWTKVETVVSGWGLSLSTWVSDAFTSVQDTVTGWGDSLATWFDEAFTKTIDAVGRWAETFATAIGTVLLFVPVLIAQTLGPLATTVGTALAGVAIAIAQPFIDGFNAVVLWVGTTYASVSEWFLRLATDIWTWVSGVAVAIAQPFIDGYNAVVLWVSTTYTSASEWFLRIAADIWVWLASVGTAIAQPFINGYNAVTQWVSSTYTSASTWFLRIAGEVGGWLGSVAGTVGKVFSDAYNAVTQWVTSTYNSASTWLTNLASSISGWLSGVVSAITSPFRTARDQVSGIIEDIIAKIERAFERAKSIASSIASILPGGSEPRMAAGGVVYGPTRALIGEAGTEAVVPLNRPLSLVDPSVRALSAFAQGKSFASGGVAGARGVTVEAGAIVVQTVATNPMRVAEMVLDGIVNQVAM